MLRTVFLGTPDFAVPSLEALIAGSQVVGVFTQPDKPVGRGQKMAPTPVKKCALDRGIPVFQPAKISEGEGFEDLKKLNPDLIVVAAYAQILKENVLNLPPYGCINVHSSLLPRWRGAAPIQWAILAGDSESGITIMKVVKALDAGAILLQRKTSISENETGGTLHDRLAVMGGEMIGEVLPKLESGGLSEREQDPKEVTYASKLTKEMECLDPSRPALELERKVRAFTPWPGTSIRVVGLGRVKIRKAKAVKKKGTEGKISFDDGTLCLGTIDGVLRLDEVQLDGKRPTRPVDFVNGMLGKGFTFPLEFERDQK